MPIKKKKKKKTMKIILSFQSAEMRLRLEELPSEYYVIIQIQLGVSSKSSGQEGNNKCVLANTPRGKLTWVLTQQWTQWQT